MPVTGVTCRYKVPAVYDDVLIVHTWIGEMKGVTITICYEITKKETGETVVTGTSSHGFTNPDLVPVRLKRDFPEVYERFHSMI